MAVFYCCRDTDFTADLTADQVPIGSLVTLKPIISWKDYARLIFGDSEVVLPGDGTDNCYKDAKLKAEKGWVARRVKPNHLEVEVDECIKVLWHRVLYSKPKHSDGLDPHATSYWVPLTWVSTANTNGPPVSIQLTDTAPGSGFTPLTIDTAFAALWKRPGTCYVFVKKDKTMLRDQWTLYPRALGPLRDAAGRSVISNYFNDLCQRAEEGCVGTLIAICDDENMVGDNTDNRGLAYKCARVEWKYEIYPDDVGNTYNVPLSCLCLTNEKPSPDPSRQ